MAQATTMKRKRSTPRTSCAEMAAASSIEPPVDLGERIAQKAYDLWESRGRRDGFALNDWLEAEAIVMEQGHEARE